MPVVVFVCVMAAMVVMWSNFVQPVTTVGQVETNAVNVITTAAGLLTELTLNRFDEVTNGQVIGKVVLFDDEQINAELAALASGAALADAKAQLVEWGKLDNAIMIKLDMFAQQVQLNIARTNLLEAERIVALDTELVKGESAIPRAQLAVAIARRDSLKSEVDDRSRLIEQWVQELSHIGPEATNIFKLLASSIQTDILNQQEQLKQLQKPLVLRAPISGKISSINRHAGERVQAGAPIVTITSTTANRIVAYVRQPLNFHPKLGDVVSVRTRTTRRRTSDAQIIKIGTQLEPISAIFLPLAKMPVETGLPIALTLPPELDLLPGEIVDLKIISKN